MATSVPEEKATMTSSTSSASSSGASRAAFKAAFLAWRTRQHRSSARAEKPRFAPYYNPRMFDHLTARLSRAIESLRGRGRITDANVAETLREARIALLEAD